MDHTGEIEYVEFVAAGLEHKDYLSDSLLWLAFSAFDKDGDGKLNPEERRAAMAARPKPGEGKKPEGKANYSG